MEGVNSFKILITIHDTAQVHNYTINMRKHQNVVSQSHIFNRNWMKFMPSRVTYFLLENKVKARYGKFDLVLNKVSTLP
jgi:hypothetical protein